MEDRCPFCGGECKYYDGESWNPGYLHNGWNRSWTCYETEIARLKTLVRDMEEIVKLATDLRHGNVIEDVLVLHNKATALLRRHRPGAGNLGREKNGPPPHPR